MTFAELFIFALIIILFFYFLNPLRKRLEIHLYKIFRGKKNSSKKHNDIPLNRNDYTKKENTPHE
jgi:hypothetical protein